MASMQATKEAIWMTKFMKELGYMKEKKVMVIRCDNQGAISLTKNPTQHAQTKHELKMAKLCLNIVQQKIWWQMCLLKHYKKNDITN
jgi:hypothetical protein